MNDILLINKLAYYDKVYGRLKSGGFVQLGFQEPHGSGIISYFSSDRMIAYFDASKFLSIHAMIDQSSLQWLSKALHYILDSDGRIWRLLSTPGAHPIQAGHADLYRYITNHGAYHDCMLMVEYTLNGNDD